MQNAWTLLVYRVPAQPTRLRLAIWRRLQKMGALYLQDAICLLPDRPELTENLSYIAGMIEEIGGTSHLFAATALLPGGAEEIAASFRAQADARLGEIAARLEGIQDALCDADHAAAVEEAEEGLKRERVAYLRARKMAYYGASPEREADVDERLERLKRTLDEQYRGGGK